MLRKEASPIAIIVGVLIVVLVIAIVWYMAGRGGASDPSQYEFKGPYDTGAPPAQPTPQPPEGVPLVPAQ